ncbi:MAG TPA: 5-(carboxyamino)imidazole ribonucleotide synthase [Woeseiaceae bacterium]|nr:5-(carboxyamino)imidazole ribonucleotide synthase [Woeseiaceae bacterium]
MTTIGVIGAGQLGLMLGEAGRKLGLEFVFLDPKPDSPAAAVGEVIVEPFESEQGLLRLAERADVVTYEFENVPVAAAGRIAGTRPLFPPPAALQAAQDRLHEKRLFESLGISVAPYRPVGSEEDLADAVRTLGAPLRLKTRVLGYDGKGQVPVPDPGDVPDAWRRLGGLPAIAEREVAFQREISVIGARRRNGEIALFPLIENRHRHGILLVSTAPLEDPELARTAAACLRRLMERLSYVGVLALELFELDGRLLANEFAPRVHNSGHWTIEGARTSQFESHLRAILDLPLGDTGALGHAAMINLIGEIPAACRAGQPAGFTLHDYGKIARPGRKLGHLTTVAGSAAERGRRVSDALKIIEN